MPRDGSGIYTKPFPDVITNTTIESAVENGTTNDLVTDANAARPIIAGGTGASNAVTARTNLQVERAGAQVTNYSSHVFENGSFWSTNATGQGAPVDGHYFVGTAVIYDTNNVLLQAYDVSDSMKQYTRSKTGSGWGAWVAGDNTHVLRAGDTMTGHLSINVASPTLALRKQTAGETVSIYGTNGALARWLLAPGTAEAESGADAGSNFGIYRYSDAGTYNPDPVIFGVRKTGNVGINCVPSQVLTVGTDADTRVGFQDVGGIANITCANAAWSAWKSLSLCGTLYANQGTGRIGILTSAPSTTLDVNGSIGVINGGVYFGRDTGGNLRPLIQLYTDNNVYIDNGAAGSMQFRTGTAAGVVSTQMTILPGGFVGIGVATPGTKLHIYEGDLNVQRTVGNTTLYMTSAGRQWAIISGQDGSFYPAYDINGAVSRLSVSPTGTFTVNCDNTFLGVQGLSTINLEGANVAGGGAVLRWRKSTAPIWHIGPHSAIYGGGSSHDLVLYGAGNWWQVDYATGIMRVAGTQASTSSSTGTIITAGGIGAAGDINTAGKVGIGYADPISNLAIAGNTAGAQTVLCRTYDARTSGIGTAFQFWYNGVVAGGIQTNGSTATFITSSDIRGKPNRALLDPAFARDIIDRLEIYDFDKDGNTIRGIGVIAQQARGVHASLGSPGATEDDWWMAEKAAPVPFMVANIQQINARLDALERRL